MERQLTIHGERLRRIIRKKALRGKVPLSDSQIWRLEQQDKFPRRVQLGPMAVGWYEDEVDDWIETRERASCKPPPLPKARQRVASD
jgi:prophage regulatory protein